MIQDIDLADIERRIVSECLANPRAARVVAKHAMGSDFLDARLGQMYDLIIGMVTSGMPVDATVVAAEATRRAKANPGGIQWLTFADLASLVALGGTAAVESLASDVRDESVRRRNITAARRALQRAETSPDAAQLAQAAIEEFKEIRDGGRTGSMGEKTLGDVLDGPTEYDWLVPGLLESADRLILTGEEGLGKTTLLRQIAVCASAGIHPLRFGQIKPVRVAYVDCENTERQWRRKASGLAAKARHLGSMDPATEMRLECASRMDITSDRDLGTLHQMVDDYDPQILVIGPLYKLVPKAINSDDDAAPLITALDSLRDRGVCLLMEAHAGHGKTAGGSRDLRPRGSSALLGWPEFGMGLAWHRDVPNAAELIRWRGDRDERDWPEAFARGGDWPWVDLNATRFGPANGHAPAVNYGLQSVP
jgi:hypothetical protein